MLIRFNIKNFLSFNKTKEGNSIEFSMIAGKGVKKKERVYDDNKIKLLKFAAIYGANASGKSNLIKALNFAKETVINGFPEGYSQKYCRIKEENKDLPSYFEFEIKLDSKYYSYGFEAILSQGKFTTEWLVELSSTGKEKIIFTRDITEGEFELGSIVKKDPKIERLEIYADDIKCDDSVLLLKVMNQNKDRIYQNNTVMNVFKDIYEWIDSKLDINYPDKPISKGIYMSKTRNLNEKYQIMSSFGTGIRNFHMTDILVEEMLRKITFETELQAASNKLSEIQKIIEMWMQGYNKEDGEDTSDIIIRTNKEFFVIDREGEEIRVKAVQFEHGKENILFELSEESDGTRRLLDLMEILFSEEGRTYVIDELDRCLHPRLTYHFIELFLQIASEKNIQLIATTHESRLLDLDLLRRDEIWFINKNENGESEIYSLEEYNPRFDKKIDKDYLEGRYKGVPIFDVFPMDF